MSDDRKNFQVGSQKIEAVIFSEEVAKRDSLPGAGVYLIVSQLEGLDENTLNFNINEWSIEAKTAGTLVQRLNRDDLEGGYSHESAEMKMGDMSVNVYKIEKFGKEDSHIKGAVDTALGKIEQEEQAERENVTASRDSDGLRDQAESPRIMVEMRAAQLLDRIQSEGRRNRHQGIVEKALAAFAKEVLSARQSYQEKLLSGGQSHDKGDGRPGRT